MKRRTEICPAREVTAVPHLETTSLRVELSVDRLTTRGCRRYVRRSTPQPNAARRSFKPNRSVRHTIGEVWMVEMLKSSARNCSDGLSKVEVLGQRNRSS